MNLRRSNPALIDQSVDALQVLFYPLEYSIAGGGVASWFQDLYPLAEKNEVSAEERRPIIHVAKKDYLSPSPDKGAIGFFTDEGDTEILDFDTYRFRIGLVVWYLDSIDTIGRGVKSHFINAIVESLRDPSDKYNDYRPIEVITQAEQVWEGYDLNLFAPNMSPYDSFKVIIETTLTNCARPSDYISNGSNC